MNCLIDCTDLCTSKGGNANKIFPLRLEIELKSVEGVLTRQVGKKKKICGKIFKTRATAVFKAFLNCEHLVSCSFDFNGLIPLWTGTEGFSIFLPQTLKIEKDSVVNQNNT